MKNNYSNRAKIHFFEWLLWVKTLFEDVILDNKPVYWVLSVHNICDKVKDYLDNSYSKRRNPQITSESKVIFLNNKKSNEYMNTNYDLSKFEYQIIDEWVLNLDITIQIYWDKVWFYNIKDANNLYWILIEWKEVTNTIRWMFLSIYNFIKLSNKSKK